MVFPSQRSRLLDWSREKFMVEAALPPELAAVLEMLERHSEDL